MLGLRLNEFVLCVLKLKQTGGARQSSETPFRPEIEGLRGLAVGLVVAAHAGLEIPGAALAQVIAGLPR